MNKIAQEYDIKMRRSIRNAALFEKIGNIWTVFVLGLILLVFTLFQPRIWTEGYWGSTLTYMTEIILLGIGEGLVMIAGCIDLSIGALSGLVGVIAAVLMKTLAPALGAAPAILIGIGAGLCTGLLIGWVNGFIVTRMKLSPFLATIGTMGACTGLSLVFAKGTEVVGLPRVIGTIINTQFFPGVPVISFITPGILTGWLVLCFFIFVLHKTRFGMRTYAVGSNQEAVVRSGVDAKAHITRLYMISGLMGAFSGIVLMMRFVSASPLTGSTSQLTAIAAAAIGGVSSRGGVGKAEGILVGALIISVVMTGLVLINVQTYWQQVAVGVIIVLSVYMDQFSSRAQLK